DVLGLLSQLLVAEIGEVVAGLPRLPRDGLEPSQLPPFAGAQDLVEEVDHSCSRRSLLRPRAVGACPIVSVTVPVGDHLRASSRVHSPGGAGLVIELRGVVPGPVVARRGREEADALLPPRSVRGIRRTARTRAR